MSNKATLNEAIYYIGGKDYYGLSIDHEKLKEYLTAIEERLDRLEAKSLNPTGYIMNDLFSDAFKAMAKRKNVVDEALDPSLIGADIKPTTPRICPVSGMFLDEPEYGQGGYVISTNGEVRYDGMFKGDFTKQLFNIGNCFSTREDAERYAKHLKAMAKLRRLGGCVPNGMVMKFDHTFEYRNVWRKDAYNQLTPEEQNALQWPNERK